MQTVKITKQKDRYDCNVYENGKFTGLGGIFYSKKAALAYKDHIEQPAEENSKDPVAAKDGQMTATDMLQDACYKELKKINV